MFNEEAQKMILSRVYGTRKEEPTFQVIVLKNDRDQSVWVDEVEEIDFSEIIKLLKLGESIFITSKKKNKVITCLTSDKAAEEKIDHYNKRRKKDCAESGFVPSLSSVVS